MTTEIQIIRRDEESKNALFTLFDSSNSPTFCSSYGSGTHCDNPERTTKKWTLWGGRGEQNPESVCNLARIIYMSDNDDNLLPAALFNIGFTGNPPTIIDKTNGTNGGVYEFSGVFIAEEFIPKILQIAVAIDHHLHSCQASAGYTKAFVSFKPDAPYQADLFSAMGGTVLFEDNYLAELGENSMHPERFKFEDGLLLECVKWDQSSTPEHHEGWHDSDPCIDSIPKTAFVFDISGGHITHDDL